MGKGLIRNEAKMPATPFVRYFRSSTLLAINLLYLMLWGFAGISKVLEGVPPWFRDKFQPTLLGKVPGVSIAFWWLTAVELAAFGLAAAALLRADFRESRPPWLLGGMLAWSLVGFLHLGFGLTLTADFNGSFQQFMYAAATWIAMGFLLRGSPESRAQP